ncbi:hypothetical protein D3C72_1832710 [compost metagenome]
MQPQRMPHHVNLVVEKYLVDRARIAQIARLQRLCIVVQSLVAAHRVRLRILALKHRSQTVRREQLTCLILQGLRVGTQIRKVGLHRRETTQAVQPGMLSPGAASNASEKPTQRRLHEGQISADGAGGGHRRHHGRCQSHQSRGAAYHFRVN